MSFFSSCSCRFSWCWSFSMCFSCRRNYRLFSMSFFTCCWYNWCSFMSFSISYRSFCMCFFSSRRLSWSSFMRFNWSCFMCAFSWYYRSYWLSFFMMLWSWSYCFMMFFSMCFFGSRRLSWSEFRL